MKKRSAALGWLWEISGREKWKVFWMALVQAVLGLASVANAWLLRGLINAAVSADFPHFRAYAALFIGLLVFQLLARALYRHLLESARSALENAAKNRLFTVLLHKDYAAVTAVHTGEWLNRLTGDAAQIADGLTAVFPEVLGMAVKLAAAIAMLLYLMPGLTGLIVVGGCALIALTWAFRATLKWLHKRIQEADGRLRVYLTERLGALMILRAFGQEQSAAQGAREKTDEHRRARMKRNHFSNLCNLGFGAAMNGAYAIGAVYCGYGILTQSLDYGTFTAVLQLIGQIQSPFANLSGYLPRYYAMLASAERMMEAESFADDDTAGETPEDFSEIRFQNVSFSYPGEAGAKLPVLRGMDFSLKKGEFLALVGHSGCGKSTALKLLLGLYRPDSGSITLDGRPLGGGCRGLMAYVPQGNLLMRGTVREVVTFGEAVPEADFRRALALACADEFVDSLEHGADTQLGERGAGLSEGQMQRLAIARALCAGRKLLLLDEATSALDEATERQVLENLRRLTDQTVIAVTHRSAALEICDKIIRMEETQP
ncbi:MAG: ABC transporter ATP-binding protein/permease [Firmicutes bacterium]|nr:ABC transporter ATP-binding protein/permease [Bacillota bacterium]